jgi:hypothetical protein
MGEVEPHVKHEGVNYKGDEEFFDCEGVCRIVSVVWCEWFNFPHVPGGKEDDPNECLDSINDLLPVASFSLWGLGDVIGEFQSCSDAEKNETVHDAHIEVSPKEFIEIGNFEYLGMKRIS